MSAVLFFLAALGAIAGAIGVVMLRNPFYSVLALVSHLVSLSVLFLLLLSEVGAGERLRGANAGPSGAALRLGGAVLGGALLVELLIALLGTGLVAVDSYGAGYAPGPHAYGTPAFIGKLLLTRFLLAFEVASFLLLIAAVGAVVLARRRGGLGEDDPRTTRMTPLGLLA